MIAFDCETTGLDTFHSAKPFLITLCDEEGNNTHYQWEVDPLTREPNIPKDDLKEIKNLILVHGGWGEFDDETAERHTIIGQNIKFDVRAISTIIPDLEWPWKQTRDTLTAGHLVNSGIPHDLTSAAALYLGIDIEPYEIAMQKAVNACRRFCRSKKSGLKNWKIAAKGLEGMPSAKEKTWKFDCWLPRAVAKHCWEISKAKRIWDKATDDNKQDKDYLKWISHRPGWDFRPPEVANGDHEYWTVTAEYANADSYVTMMLWKKLKSIIEERDLWEIYKVKENLTRVVYSLETRGITLSKSRMEELTDKYKEGSEEATRVCENIAASYDFELTMPKGSRSNSLTDFCFNILKLPVVKRTDSGNPSLDKDVLEEWVSILPQKSKAAAFARNLRNKRKMDTATTYMDGYRRFWLPYKDDTNELLDDWFVMHPSINPTGTAHLRFSSSTPNEQNISKKEGFNLRYIFGPAPGREWWSLDYSNIEKRIPVYEVQEEDIMALFERPNDPPYFGSEHLLIAHILHKDLFEKCINPDTGILDGRIFKKKYKSTHYQTVKNGNFALQYQCSNHKADATYRVKDAGQTIRGRFAKQTALNQHHVSHANRFGYVETLPDRGVNPKRGYPIVCTRGDSGNVKSTVPLNYHVSGTAMWCMIRAMIRVQDFLDEVNRVEKGGYYINIQVHDELVFDFPKRGNPVTCKEGTNYDIIKHIQGLMAQSGNDLIPPIPTPVSIEFHPVSWSEGISIVV